MAQDVWQAGFKERLNHLMTCDPEVRERVPDSGVASMVRPTMGLAQLVDAVMTGYADRDAVKERLVTVTATGARQLTSDHTTLTYEQLWKRARAVATSWQTAGTGPRVGEMVCSIGTGSNNYAALELACIAANVVSVPLIANAGQAQWQAILSETSPAAVAVDVAYLDTAIAAILASQARPAAIYVLDYLEGTWLLATRFSVPPPGSVPRVSILNPLMVWSMQAPDFLRHLCRCRQRTLLQVLHRSSTPRGQQGHRKGRCLRRHISLRCGSVSRSPRCRRSSPITCR